MNSVSIRPLLLLLIGVGALLCSAADPAEPCNNYSACLEQLENKQSECSSASASGTGQAKGSNTNAAAASTTSSCDPQQKAEMHDELLQLHLRRTELMRNCVQKQLVKAVSINNPKKEQKCQSAAAKLKNIAAEGQRRRKKKSRKAQAGGDDSPSAAGKSQARQCRRIKKVLNRKCRQISKCCSVAHQCQSSASTVDTQIQNLKKELQACKSKGKGKVKSKGKGKGSPAQ